MGWRARKRASAAAGSARLGRAAARRARRCAGVDGLQHAAVEEGGEGRVEEDGGGGGGLLEQQAVGEGLGCASAEGEDDVAAAERRGEGLGLELAEVGFAVGGEDGGDGEAGAGLDEGVEVEELPAEAGGEQAADGGLAGAHEAGEDDAAEVGGDGRSVAAVSGLAHGWGRRIGAIHFGLLDDDTCNWRMRRQNKAATFVGSRLSGSGGCSELRSCLSIQSCSHSRLTRSLPPKAGIGKVAELERAQIHPETEITSGQGTGGKRFNRSP